MANIHSVRTLSIVTIITLLCVFYVICYANIAKSENVQISLQNMSRQSSGFNAILGDNKNSSPSFLIFNNQTGVVTFWLHPFSQDINSICNIEYQCVNNSSGWNDSTSLEISTVNNTINTWSSIHGPKTEVKTNDFYQVVTHMKTNKWVQQSHIIVEGYEEASNEWYQMIQCPSGINGPTEWRQFNCVLAIPENVTAIRPVLNAGWSSDAKENATTWFDSLYLIKSNPTIFDTNLKAELVHAGLESPTDMVFLDSKIIITEKNGTVQLIDSTNQKRNPILEVKVVNDAPERGMLGIAVDKKDKVLLFLYYTLLNDSGIHNQLLKYEYTNNKLINPKVILDLPAGYQHNGGKILIGEDNYIYLTTGEAKNQNLSRVKNIAVNYGDSEKEDPDGRAGILRVDFDGRAPNVSILGDSEPLNKYYAYGIRNSFGMDFDPLSGKLWDTENGPAYDDEINLVNPGFNSGWEIVQGIRPVSNRERVFDQVDNLTNFNGKGNYSSPEFIWNHTVGPTALKFVSTDKLGKEYENDIFVADINNGRIYHFNLNQNRTALLLEGPLVDKVADSDEELTEVIFAQGFGMITDLEIGPDGYLYILSYDQGKIYKIVPGYMNQNIVDYLDLVS